MSTVGREDPPQKPQRTPDVMAAIQELADAVDEADKAISTMQSRVHSVTSCVVGSDNDAPRAVKSSVCSVSIGIREQVERLRDIAERVRSHTEALEC